MNSKPHQKNFSVISGLDMGLFAPEDLETILHIINKYKVPATKITSAQRLALLGMDKDKMASLQEELKNYIGTTPENGVTYVQSCPGLEWCKYGIRDSLSLGKELKNLSMKTPFKAKVKVGVAGCRMCCTEPYVRDLGIFASKKGWTLVFGGNGGNNARIADIVAEGLNDEEVLALAKKCLTVYQEEANPRSRTARFMERFGIEAFRKRVLEKEEQKDAMPGPR
ncbi:NAD(P)H-nitrite reductase [Desulfocapsa sulfexigens DSM 10523]|uniref:NAD(P)H-nitrite reductase n=1 Tax=Desulfocapsa sulfexigens (strain DSM 10523 / SB164P1) TaxID=1167006 RepID=M1PTV9_DESSD|nr:NAD(P)H-nitrite reductase [Desulfocapsa sulfexigens]AGF79786.1 NAD(P)H-nitrite reductase [Desulfocapsa sulfexigens DSM 10523]